LKSRTGRVDEINTCIACNQACLDHVFVGKIASCLVNPRACHETELPISQPRVERVRIGVVGAGPAGCALAVTAAQLGHDVTLFDAESRMGGQFLMAQRIPGKEEFHETLRYFRTLMDKHSVQVQLNTRISVEDVKSRTDIDKWVMATGVLPRDPKIPGQDHPNVLSYIDVLKHGKPVGNRVAVIGAGGIGFDLSEFLIHWDGQDRTADEVSLTKFYEEWGIDSTLQHRGGLCPPVRHTAQSRKLYLLQRKKGKLGANLGKTTGWIHRATLTQSGAVEMIGGVTYEKIDEHGHLHLRLSNGELRVLEVDTVVICAGQLEHDALSKAAAEVSPELASKVFTIGGAFQAGELDAKRAINMGVRLAYQIHRPDVRPGDTHIWESHIGTEEKMYQLLRRYFK
jgi:2,4-dienoyl-CoA reductase (NADPH2)